MDPFMWCSFEKLCKLKPETLEVGKYFSEINPKILMYNNNFNTNYNTNLNANLYNNNNTSNYTNAILNNNNANANNKIYNLNSSFNTNYNNNNSNINQPKDFALYSSEDYWHNGKIKNSLNDNIINKNFNFNNINNIENINNQINKQNNYDLNNISNNNLSNNNYNNNNFSGNIPLNTNNKNFDTNINQWQNMTNSGNGNTNGNGNCNANANLSQSLNTNDQYNKNNNNNFSSSGVQNFQMTKNDDSDYDHQAYLTSMNNRFQSDLRAFTEISDQQNQINTPVLNKDKLDLEYSNLNNHHNYINEKQCNLRPFNFSGSPNQLGIGQNLNKIICDSDLMKKYNTSNNIQSASNGNKGAINNNENINDTIQPFNFNIYNPNKNINPSNNINNINLNNFYPVKEQEINENGENEYENLKPDNSNANTYSISNQISNNNNNNYENENDNNNNNTNNQESNNIFKNINLGGNDNGDVNENNQFLLNSNNSNNINMNNYRDLSNLKNINLHSNIIKSYDNVTKNRNNLKSNKNISSNINNMTYETYMSLKNTEPKCEIVNSFLTTTKVTFRDVGQLLKIFGEILKQLSLFKCQEVLNIIDQLPNNHKNSGIILSFIGRAYFEMHKYKESEKYYKECLKIEPYRLEGVDYFSSCLWHLKDQYQLSTLANHVLEQSLFSQETWVVLGNCYSLQKEHEVAVKFFARAIQLNNNYAYAYTLCGHEYFANEAYAESKDFYTKAIAIDSK
jgi:hypothetical protein